MVTHAVSSNVPESTAAVVAGRAAQGGFALITMLILLALLMALLLTHFSLTWIELSTTRSSMHSFVGFYAAEAGLNLRADQVRQTFVGFGQPAGTSPDEDDPCTGSNVGSGDFACADYAFQRRDVVTYMEETAGSNLPIVIPRGETYQDLSAREFHYAVYSNAHGAAGATEAVLEMHFMSRAVPLFQFAAFYDKDLEILPDPSMQLAGPVHTNGDLYVGTAGTLDFILPVTVAGRLYRGRKDVDACPAGAVRVNDPDDLSEIPDCTAGRLEIDQADVVAWNKMIDVEVAPLTVPPPTMLDAAPGNTYWDRADLRIVLDLGLPAIQVRAADGSADAGKTAALGACAAVGASSSLYNQREARTITLLDVDVRALLNCAHGSALMGAGKGLDDATDGGLVWYFGVAGPDSAALNGYGVRVRNGADLVATVAGAPSIKGLTIATDQALYVQGNYNSAPLNKKPAALLADTVNVLSNAWADANSAGALASRVATPTTIQAALLAGTDRTGGAEGPAGQDTGGYNGGLESFMRLHEAWAGVTLVYRGSFVSLFAPRHVDGPWIHGAPYYTAPVRDWLYDDDFDEATLLPPLTPSFVYLKRELFVRQFEL